MRRPFKLLSCIAILSTDPAVAAPPPLTGALSRADIEQAEHALHQTFTNLHFEDFGPAPVKGPLYQANAGGRIVYFAPTSGHLLFAAVYDRNGVNVTALAQDEASRKRLNLIDPAKALAIGPRGAPQVIEFTDPECPFCQALERFWATKAAEGKPVRRLVYFVSGIHPQAAARAENILCSPNPAAEFKAIYSGARPKVLRQCASGHAKVASDATLVSAMGVSGTPTLIIDGKLIAGFQQAELEQFVDGAKPQVPGSP